MQDTLIGLGRGIDGVVGRMVDRFGGDDRAGARDEVALTRYVVLSIAPGRERVLHVDETLVTDGATGRRLEDRLLAPFAGHVDRPHLRVHTRVLRRWPRRAASRSSAGDDRPAQRAEPATAPARQSATETATPAAVQVPDTGPATAPEKAAPRRADDLTERVLDILAGGDAAGLSMAELVEATGERSARLRARLTKLIVAGKVRRAGDGLKTRYRLTQS